MQKWAFRDTIRTGMSAVRYSPWTADFNLGDQTVSFHYRSAASSSGETPADVVVASARRPLTDVRPSYAPLGECPLDSPYGMPLSRTPFDLWHSHMGFPCGHGAEEVELQL